MNTALAAQATAPFTTGPRSTPPDARFPLTIDGYAVVPPDTALYTLHLRVPAPHVAGHTGQYAAHAITTLAARVLAATGAKRAPGSRLPIVVSLLGGDSWQEWCEQANDGKDRALHVTFRAPVGTDHRVAAAALRQALTAPLDSTHLTHAHDWTSRA